MEEMGAKDIHNGIFARQVEVVTEAASTGKDRAEFIANPLGYAKKRGVSLDNQFAKMIKDELVLVERYAVVLGSDNPYLAENSVVLDPVMRRKGISDHPGAAPVAVLAAVQAASSVVQTVVSIKMAMQYS